MARPAVGRPSGDEPRPDSSVVAASTTRAVLQAVAQVMPDDGEDVVTRVDIRSGWAGAVHVRVHSRIRRSAGDELGPRLRRLLDEVHHGRHTVEIVWGSAE